jgi:hypothetical protein
MQNFLIYRQKATENNMDIDPQYIKYSKKIILMGKKDQAILKKYNIINNEIIELQKKNTEELKKIIKQIGYPKTSIVGKEASLYAWLIVQHSDFDLSFQEEVLNMLKLISETENTNKQIAYLEDRILINKHLPQIYGTQFKIKNGIKIPHKITGIKNVNKRRRKMGLNKLEDYLK